VSFLVFRRNKFEAEDNHLQDDGSDTDSDISEHEGGIPEENCFAGPMEPTPKDVEKLKDTGVQVDLSSDEATQRFTMTTLLSNPEQLYTFTGLRSFDLLDTIVECVADIDSMSKFKQKVLPLKDRVVLTFIKLKLNLSFAAIAVLFGIDRATASRYFRHTLPRVSKVLKTVITWPDRETIRNNLPLSFENFQSTRCVLDCAETPVEKCHCLRCRVMTWS